MKTLHILYIFCFCLSVFGTSCEKSDLNQSTNEDLAVPSNTRVSSSYHENHLAYLHRGLDPNQIMVRDSRYSLQDALDLLNDGMNHLYCRPDEYRNETVSFTDVFSVPKTSGEIAEGDLANLMDDIALFAGDNYYDESGSNKQPLLFNMTESSGPSPSYFYIEATFIMEKNLLPSGGDNYPYSTDWKWAQLGNDVTNQCNTENVNLDAADLFRRDLRQHIVYRNNAKKYYFKNPYAVCFSGASNNCSSQEIPFTILISEFYDNTDLLNGNDATSSDNFEDLLIFRNYTGYPNFHTCITDDEMNFYYESMYDLALNILPSPVGDNAIMQIEVGYELLAPEFTTTIFHSMVVIRATKVEVLEEDDNTALPCIDC